MKLAVVGVGNAGSRIANRIVDVERATGRNLTNGNTLLVNSTEPAFDAPEYVPEERRLTIGDVHWSADGAGIDGDPDVGAEVAREERNEINRAFDLIEFHEVDGVLVTAGLAGGTGGGAGAVVIDQLQSITDEPVYAVGVLPHASEGERSALAAARSLRSFVETADNVVAFDNDEWLGDDSPGGWASDSTDDATTTDDGTEPGAVAATAGADANVAVDPRAGNDETDEAEATEAEAAEAGGIELNGEDYAEANAALAERLVVLFAAGEFAGPAAPESRLDSSDIVRTLDTGGVSSIGYASTEVPRPGRLRSWLRALGTRIGVTADREADEEAPTDAATINRLVRRAARSKLTLPCEVSSADRAVIVLSGPSRALSRKGFESGRYWLEGEADVVDVMAGDEPHDRSTALTAVVLFSNVTDVPRIDAIQEQAVAGRRTPSASGMQFGQANPP